ncbi:MAG: phosphatidylglycerophosphatase A, partial [Burkholderiaceae bacterium]|nr:phosphatidylglycerophosphatase A [Burkholderiaceae bacterium]
MSEASTTADVAPRRATARFMLAHPARWIALGFGSGLSPKAPGTVGTLWAWASFLALHPHMTDAR